MKKKTGSGRGVEVTPRDLAKALAGFSTGIRGVRSTVLKMGPKASVTLAGKSKIPVHVPVPMLDGCGPTIIEKHPGVNITPKDFARALEDISLWILSVRKAILKLDPKTTVTVGRPSQSASAAPMLDGCAPAPMLDGCAPPVPPPSSPGKRKR